MRVSSVRLPERATAALRQQQHLLSNMMNSPLINLLAFNNLLLGLEPLRLPLPFSSPFAIMPTLTTSMFS